MLIDIEKYVVQQLAPNKRIPVNIGLASTLLAPFNGIINAANTYYYGSEFDTGTPGQVGVLEYILQSFVDPNIRITDGTGSLIDFRVLVPASLSDAARGEVVRYCDKYKLTSKRYEIVDQISWDGGTVPTTPLAFSYGPVASETSPGNYLISFALNLSGPFPTLIKNGSSVYFDQVKEYVANERANFPVTNVGGWSVKVADLVGNMEISPSVITAKPAWLNRVAYTHNVDSHEFTLYINATEDVEVRLTAKTAPQPSGITTGDIPWNDQTYITGTKEYTGVDFTQLFRFNPVTLTVDGVLRLKDYTLHIRRVASPTTVFEYDFTTKNVSNPYPPTDFTLVNPSLPSCNLNGGRGPTIGDIFYSNETATNFQFDAQNVPRLFWRLTSGGSILRSTKLVYYLDATPEEITLAAANVPTPTVQIITGNSPVVKYETLAAGGYQMELEGASCSSDVSVKPITIAGTALAFASGYPTYASVGSTYTMRIKINKSASYSVRIVNTTTATEVYNQSFDFSGDATLVIASLPVGVYAITVGSLTYTLTISAPVSTGDYVPVLIFDCLKECADIVITGTSENWLINDHSDLAIPSDRENIYMVAGQIAYRGKGKLTNYPYQSNNPGQLKKMVINPATPVGTAWNGGDGPNYTVQPYNQSCSTVSFDFKPVL